MLERILVIRTDRIGDLLLTTPAIHAIRRAFPRARITALVGPHGREVIEDNPDVNDWIVFPAQEVFRSLIQQFEWIRWMRRQRFQVAVVFHPHKWFHIATWLAKIPRRVGYRRKLAFLLTETIPDTKAKRDRHEVEYNLELARLLGASVDQPKLVFPIPDPIRRSIERRFLEYRLTRHRPVVLHPASSDPRKVWDLGKMAQIADWLMTQGEPVLLVGGEEEREFIGALKARMRRQPIDLSGRMSLKELGALLERSRLLVSTDSGPVHIAAAVGSPCVVVAERREPGATLRRWGPWGAGHTVIEHPDISVEEVKAAISRYLNGAS